MKELEPINLFERVIIGKNNVVAKIDTGAETSSIDKKLAMDIGFTKLINDFESFIQKYNQADLASEKRHKILTEIRKKFKDNPSFTGVKAVNSVNGVTLRPYIKTIIKIKNRKIRATFNISDRSSVTKHSKVLIGLNILRNKFYVLPKNPMKTILFIGNTYFENTRNLQKDGYKVILFKDTRDTKFRTNLEDQIFPVNLSDHSKIIDQIKNLKVYPDAIITAYDKYIIAKSIIGKYFEKKVPSIESAELATDKGKQRAKFYSYDKSITPAFREIKSEDDIESFIKEYGSPVIIKPTNLSKSLLVSKCDGIDQALKAWKDGKKRIDEILEQTLTVNNNSRFIIEEFLVGSKHSIEVFMDSDNEVHIAGIVDVLSANEVGFDDNFEYVRTLPSKLKKDQQKEVEAVAVKAMKALDLTNSPGHVEIMYTKSGPKVIEVNARVGGYRDRMFRNSYGISLLENELRLSLGKKLKLKKKKSYYTAVFEIFPKEQGTFKKFLNRKAAEKLPSVVYFSGKVKVGQEIGLSKDGFKRAAVVMLVNDDATQFELDYKFIKDNVRVYVT